MGKANKWLATICYFFSRQPGTDSSTLAATRKYCDSITGS